MALARILQDVQPVARELKAVGITRKERDQDDVLRMQELEMGSSAGVNESGLFGQGLDEPKRPTKISVAMSLGIFAASTWIGALGGCYCLFHRSGRHTFWDSDSERNHIHILCLLVRFLPYEGIIGKIIALQNEAGLQQQISRLLAIGICFFLLLIFLGQTALFALRSRLPSCCGSSNMKEQRDSHCTKGCFLVSAVVIFFAPGVNLPPNPESRSEEY